jgi:serine/threonine protein kinase
VSFVCPECARSYSAPGFCTEDGGTLEDATHSPLLGTLVGSYRVATMIGQGGMGEVYRGVHPEIGSRVAIKVLTADAARAPSLVERFFAEARAVNVIRHEGIVSVLDLARLSDGRPYIVMEYLDGAPLSKLFRDHRPMPLGGLVQLLISVVDALQAAHAHGITHRDLKPDNVFVTSTGRTKVLDFGIAKLRPEIAGLSDATRTGALLGTPFYMSPEQARGQTVDMRSDLYSFGVIAFEGATGRRPFEADNLYDQLRQHIEMPAPRPRDLRPELPAALETVILRALEKDPAHRFQSAKELGDALRQSAQFLPPDSFVTLAGQASSSFSRPRLAGAATPATVPGYSATFTNTETARSSSGGRTLVFGLLGLFGVGGLVVVSVVVALFVLGDNDTISVVNTPAPSAAPAATEPAGGSKPAAGVINLTRVDPVAFCPKAQELARSQLPDAELSTISVDSPEADGTVNFKAEEPGTLVYSFVSRKAAGGNATGDCAVWVTLAGQAPDVSRPPMASCMMGSGKPPRCSLGKILKRAAMKGQGTTITYGPQSSWTLISEEGDIKMVADDC